MVAYTNQSNNNMKAKYNYMKRNVLLSFGRFHHFGVIYMVAHSLWL
jgi:hypothetical protein